MEKMVKENGIEGTDVMSIGNRRELLIFFPSIEKLWNLLPIKHLKNQSWNCDKDGSLVK